MNVKTNTKQNHASAGGRLQRFVIFLIDMTFPRLEETILLRREYMDAVATYRRTHGRVGAATAAEYADAFNAIKYCWQKPLRSAVWREI